ncbi:MULTISPECIES: helix-turn-helix domain-containing protein [Aerococcus]|nr:MULTISPECIES: helix-turn-helix transcriptional regulator [Aerococcus]KAA9293730.1 helix-turn-helix transcriptional regulator [Aerococcus mictus]MCY3027127.1 helix-turn-helix domain-containing protein [Aerococcus loyolae]MCY3066419.1 helix-turn-helix domain-containing protein [Aerococcus mictus]MCY3075823.1 helix-turn-helix domain-containing protein [Aerococcus mictus]MDK6375106.1 helix-turn-helix transcriptional regulator [Aerococcus urinae]
MEINKDNVGKRIKKIRVDRGWSLEAFGEKIEDPPVKPGIISRWENGKSLPNNQRIKAIADLGGITVDELLYGSKNEVLNDLIITTYKDFSSDNYLYWLQKRPQDFEKILSRIKEKLSTIKRDNLINKSDIYKDKIEEWLEGELYRGERNDKNTIDYLNIIVFDALFTLEDFIDDPLTKEAVKKGNISKKTYEEVINLHDFLNKTRDHYLSLRNKFITDND